MFNNTNGNTQPTQTLVHLPRQQQQQQSSSDRQLPRGECRYILPDMDAEGVRQRCTCVSFSLNQNVPGSLCGCGHQAWHHISEPAGKYVPLDEHIALLDKFRKLEEISRKLQEEVVKEKRERERAIRDTQTAHYQNMYHMRVYVDNNMQHIKTHADDRLERIEDKAAGASDDVEKLTKSVQELDEIVMRLEEKLDSPIRRSMSLTPVLEDDQEPNGSNLPIPSRPGPQLPFRIERQHPDAWDVRVILVPSKLMQFAYNIDSMAYRRCQTRGLHQDLHLQDRTYQTFVQCTEASFMAIFRRRAWMPLQCLRSSDMSLGQLEPNSINPSLWDYNFLESQCMAHDKLQGDVIFIALQHEELSWEDIRALPSRFGSDESCWEYHEQLDSNKAKEAIAAEDRMDTDRPRIAGDSEYHSPPPYSSRASVYAETPRQGPTTRPSALEVLATASSMATTHHIAPSISERSNYSAPTIISERSISTLGSIDSALALSESDQQHPSKRTKRGIFLRSPTSPSANSSSTGVGIQSAPSSPPTQGGQLYYSGRAKRKIQPTARVREPMDWRTSELSLKTLLHRTDSKEKRPSTSSSNQQQQTETS